MTGWLFVLALSCEDPPSPGALVGLQAPALELSTVAGHRLVLPDPQGAPTLLFFWASWCGPCRAEAAAVTALGSATAEVRTVSVNVGEAPATAASAAAALGLAGPQIVDLDGAVQAAFEVDSLPVVIVVDGAGVVRYRQTAASPEARLFLEGPS